MEKIKNDKYKKKMSIYSNAQHYMWSRMNSQTNQRNKINEYDTNMSQSI